jgi:hypothetical protein
MPIDFTYRDEGFEWDSRPPGVFYHEEYGRIRLHGIPANCPSVPLHYLDHMVMPDDPAELAALVRDGIEAVTTRGMDYELNGHVAMAMVIEIERLRECVQELDDELWYCQRGPEA